MLSVFISYRRVDSAALATLIALQLKEKYDIDAYVDTRNTDSGGPFPDRLRSAIERSDIFVCLLGATTLESAWVLTEIEHAHNLRKIMIPLFQERYVAPSPLPNTHIEVLLQYDGVQFLDVRNLFIDESITQLARMVANSEPRKRFYARPAFILSIVVLIAAVLAIVILPTFSHVATPTASSDVMGSSYIAPSTEANLAITDIAEPQTGQAPAMTQQANMDATNLASQTTDADGSTTFAAQFGTQWSGTFFPNNNLSGKGVLVNNIQGLNFNWGTGTPMIMGSAVDGISSDNFSARFTSVQTFLDGTYTFFAASDDGIRLYIDGELLLDKFIVRHLTQDTVTATLTAGPHNLTVEYFEGLDQSILQVQWILHTVTTEPTSTQVTQLPDNVLQTNMPIDDVATKSTLILTPIAHNADWTPMYQTFNGVEMALVPVGCFMMGSENGSDNQKPVNQQCFSKPFWIDRYEVTNKQYGSVGSFIGDNYPRDSVTWFGAHDFCLSRESRLPTEREWEYAARGPDNLLYPWGNDFVADNVIDPVTSSIQPAEVGSFHTGDSWVGASDLSDNVWEWVSSRYKSYPYEINDSREAKRNDSNNLLVLRGGTWDHSDPGFLSAFFRIGDYPDHQASHIGFRCARDY